MLRINLGNIERALTRAFTETSEGLEQHLVGMFDDPVWGWPNQTKRQNGQVVGSPRNIVDGGDLRGSQTLEFPAVGVASLEWSVPYASSVFLGGGPNLPARNLPLLGLREFNFPQKFAIKARALL